MDLIEKIAKVTHITNKAWCEVNNDYSQVEWENAPEWQRESAIDGVKFHLENKAASPSASHDNWMQQKIADGWVYGKEKDENLKTHPCIVPFSSLPKHQQIKDILFRNIVHSINQKD